MSLASVDPLAQTSLTQLAGEEFFVLFRRTVTSLEKLLDAQGRIDFNVLQHAHDLWREEVIDAFDKKVVVSSDKALWIYVLSVIAKHVCNANCVSYSIEPMHNNELIAEHQQLLLKYPSQYTGLEFVRALHLKIYFSITGGRPLPDAIILIESHELGEILKNIKNNPESARKYANLLHLPQA